MRTREATIEAEHDYDAAGTGIYPIRETDPISRILIPFGVTVGANARLQHISQCLSKIEIVDGSDVLFSMSGDQLDGLSRMDRGSGVGMYACNTRSTTDYGYLAIDFGRYLYDKEFAFDPTKFKNPQIRITRSLTAVEAICTHVIIAIHAYLMEGLVSPPRAFFMKKEQKSWQATDNEWEYTQMAKDYVYRRIFLQALTKTVSLGTHWSRARLSEDNDKRVPFDVLVHDQVAQNAEDYGDIIEHVIGTRSEAADLFFAAPSYSGRIMVMPLLTQNGLLGNTWDGGQYNITAAAAGEHFRGIVVGLVPQGMVAFHMGPLATPEDWYDPREIGSLRLEVLGEGAHMIHLITEQLRTY